MAFEEPQAIVPEGEAAGDALIRGWAALEDAFAAASRLPVLVSHGQLISLNPAQNRPQPSALALGRRFQRPMSFG